MREVTVLYHCSLLLQVMRGVLAGTIPVCELWRGLYGVSSLPYTALAGVDVAAAGTKLALAQESTSVSSNGPMGVGWGWVVAAFGEVSRSNGYWPLAQMDKTTGLLVGVILGGYMGPAPHALFTASTHRTLVPLHYCSHRHSWPVPLTAGESKPQDGGNDHRLVVHSVHCNVWLIWLFPSVVPMFLCSICM